MRKKPKPKSKRTLVLNKNGVFEWRDDEKKRTLVLNNSGTFGWCDDDEAIRRQQYGATYSSSDDQPERTPYDADMTKANTYPSETIHQQPRKRLLTLRLGMFFDGTANNSYSAEWGKHELDRYYPRSRDDVDNHDFPDGVDGSAANELTNIEKLKNLYNAGDLIGNTWIAPIYITGVGTDNKTEITHARESIAGEAFGVGKYGVVAKAKWAIDEICDQLLSFWAATSEGKFDAIGKIEFDVFGFSRGAAAARHFINLVLSDLFLIKFRRACDDAGVPLVDGFLNKNSNIAIKFVGLFDTVAAIVAFDHADFTPTNDNSGDVKLWLDPRRIGRLVHLTAHPKTEYRKNFCLNRINPAPHFKEYQLAGCHSDIGGGYHAAASFDHDDYQLPRFERQLVAMAEHSAPSRSLAEDTVKKQLEQERQALLKSGWPDNFTTEIDASDFGNGPAKANGRLYLQRTVEGDLSRLYLRLMYGLAKHHGVPVDDKGGAVWERYSYYKVSNTCGDRFIKTCENALKSACKGDISALECGDDDPLIADFMAQNLIHHSAEINNIANAPNSDRKRVTFECHKEK